MGEKRVKLETGKEKQPSGREEQRREQSDIGQGPGQNAKADKPYTIEEA